MLTNFNFEQSVSKAPRKTSPVGFTLKAANILVHFTKITCHLK